MNVFFRVDSSKHMGSGHVMRCLTLAEAFKEKGAKCHFIMRDLPGNLSKAVEEKGFVVKLLPFVVSEHQQENYSDEYAFWLGVSWEQDASETLDQLEIGCDLLIVDHYALGSRWEITCQQKCNQLFVIDDLANRRHECDYLLDHNFYTNAESRYEQLVTENCIQFCGPKYALISRQVLKARKHRELYYQLPTGDQFNCLVFMGGADAGGYSEKVVRKILSLNANIEVTLILGRSNPARDKLQECFNQQVNVLIQPDNYFDLLAKTDFVVGAGGVSTLERFCIGVPAFVFQVAENQSEICQNLDASKAACFVGKAAHASALDLLLTRLKKATIGQLAQMSEAGKNLVDGCGVWRLLKQTGLHSERR